MAPTLTAAMATATADVEAAVGIGRRSRFGDFVLVAFLLAQASDGVFTYVGVSVYGAHDGRQSAAWLADGSRWAGSGASTARRPPRARFGIALHLSSVHRVVAALAALYVAVAVAPAGWRSCSTAPVTRSQTPAWRLLGFVLLAASAPTTTTWRIAAVGTARIAPTMPRSLPPISSATITVTALTPTCRDMIFGTRMWFSNCCCRTKKIRTKRTFFERHGGRDRDRGNRREDRPDDGNHLADGRDQREHVEERNAEQPQADRRRRADDAAEQQLAAEPRADLDRDVAARGGDARAVAAREEPQHRRRGGCRRRPACRSEDQDRERGRRCRRRRSPPRRRPCRRRRRRRLGRALDRLLHRQVLAQQPLSIRNSWPRSNMSGSAVHTARLVDERRDDQEADQRDECRGWLDRERGWPASAGSASVPIGSTFCRSMSRTIGLKPIASRPLT